MEESIRSAFALPEQDVRSFSPLALAYLGDSVYELVLRTCVVEKGNRQVKLMDREGSNLAKAETQARMAAALQDILTDEESAAYRRGRNTNSSSVAKHASVLDYRQATGLESLFGYLYLTGREERIFELVRKGWENI